VPHHEHDQHSGGDARRERTPEHAAIVAPQPSRKRDEF
jgi:hypothetical protein